MEYNFDIVHDRSQNQSVKHAFVKDIYGSEDVLPMWVADMDFKTAQPIIDALASKVSEGIYGYTALDDSYFNAFIDWVMRKHNWQVKKEWLINSTGVVSTIIHAINSLTDIGDAIIIQSPVYGPFRFSILNHGRKVLDNPLKVTDGHYSMDFDDLEDKISQGAKVMILCNPHNPVGRVWSQEDLSRLADLIVANDMYLISDEIHSDLIMKGHKHIPIASLNKDISNRTITCMAPSKTFNLAGLQAAIAVTSNNDLYKKLKLEYEKMDMNLNNCFGQTGFTAAYNHGEKWLDQLLVYLEKNMDFVVDYVENHIPQLKVVKPQGTYLMWLDCRGLGMSHEDLKTFMAQKAKVGLTPGDFFGDAKGFMRYNIASPLVNVKEGLVRIERAIKELK